MAIKITHFFPDVEPLVMDNAYLYMKFTLFGYRYEDEDTEQLLMKRYQENEPLDAHLISYPDGERIEITKEMMTKRGICYLVGYNHLHLLCDVKDKKRNQEIQFVITERNQLEPHLAVYIGKIYLLRYIIYYRIESFHTFLEKGVDDTGHLNAISSQITSLIKEQKHLTLNFRKFVAYDPHYVLWLLFKVRSIRYPMQQLLEKLSQSNTTPTTEREDLNKKIDNDLGRVDNLIFYSSLHSSNNKRDNKKNNKNNKNNNKRNNKNNNNRNNNKNQKGGRRGKVYQYIIDPISRRSHSFLSPEGFTTLKTILSNDKSIIVDPSNGRIVDLYSKGGQVIINRYHHLLIPFL